MSIALPGYIRKVWAKRAHKVGISKFCATLFKERKAMPWKLTGSQNTSLKCAKIKGRREYVWCLLVCVLCLFSPFWDGVSIHSSGKPQTCSGPLDSASQKLGLQACATLLSTCVFWFVHFRNGPSTSGSIHVGIHFVVFCVLLHRGWWWLPFVWGPLEFPSSCDIFLTICKMYRI